MYIVYVLTRASKLARVYKSKMRLTYHICQLVTILYALVGVVIINNTEGFHSKSKTILAKFKTYVCVYKLCP